MENLLQADIASAIQKNLPQAVGENLQKLLKEGETNAKLVENQKNSITLLNKNVIDLNNLLIKHGDLKTREDRVITKEEEVSQRERNLEITLLETKLAESEKRADITFSLVDKLVRNTVVKKNILNTEDVGGVPVVDGQGFAHYPVPSSKHYDETKTEE